MLTDSANVRNQADIGGGLLDIDCYAINTAHHLLAPIPSVSRPSSTATPRHGSVA